jgi:tRNA (guanine-N7-)-methyltransferase
VLAVITPMVQLIEASGGFDRPAVDGRPWRAYNPLAVPTERETYVLAHGLPVYRVLYLRNDRKLLPLTSLEDRLETVDNPV